MDHKSQQDQTTPKRLLSEDWISVLIGLALVALVALIGLASIPWPLFGVFT